MIPQWISNVIVVLVSGVFAVNFGAQFILQSWQPDPYIYGIFMTVVGGSFALRKSDKAERDGSESA
ncbi:MAG: hypothetical protein ACRDTZ_03390 [Pseudonocardiaceae bacterium]